MKRFVVVAGRRAGALVALALVVLALAHLPPARSRVARWAESRAGEALGAQLEIGRLDYNLATLDVTLFDLRLKNPATGALILGARRLRLDAPWAVLRQQRRLSQIGIDSPTLAFDELGTLLAGRPPGASASPSPFYVDRVRVTDFDLIGNERSEGLSIDLRDIALDGASRGGVLSCALTGGPGWVRIADYRADVGSVAGGVDYDGSQLLLRTVHLLSRDHDIVARGTVGLLSAEPSWDVSFESATDVGAVLAAWPAVPATRGRAQVTGRVTGRLGSPRLDVRARAGHLAFGAADASNVEVDATIGDGAGVVIERMVLDAFGGRVEAHLLFPGEGAPDRGEATARGLDLAAALSSIGVQARVASRAEASLSFEGDIAEPRTWSATGRATLRPSGGNGVPASGSVAVTQRGEAWRVRLADGRLGGLDVRLAADGNWPAPPHPMSASTLRGSADLRAAEVATALPTLTSLGLAVPEWVTTRLSGPVSLPVALGGTLAAPNLSVPLGGQHLAFAGVGDVAADGEVRLAGGEKVELRDIVLRAGDRTVLASGTIDLPRQRLAMDVDARGVHAADLPALGIDPSWLPAEGTIAARGHVAGTIARPEIRGDVRGPGSRVVGTAGGPRRRARVRAGHVRPGRRRDRGLG